MILKIKKEKNIKENALYNLYEVVIVHRNYQEKNNFKHSEFVHVEKKLKNF